MKYTNKEQSTAVPGSVPSYLKELGTRIEEAANALGVRKIAALAMGVSTDSLARYIRGGNEAPIGAITRLAKASGFSIEWLASGEGQKMKSISDYAKQENAEPLVSGTERQSGVKLQDDGTEDFVFVPRYDVEGSMGNGSVIHSEQIVDHLAFKEDWVRLELGASPKNLILISAVGDSMEPTLRAGDLLLVDCGVRSFYQDAIYVFTANGELRVKRIQRLFSGALVIKSDNKQYSEEELSPDQAETLRIIGRVAWAGRRM